MSMSEQYILYDPMHDLICDDDEFYSNKYYNFSFI